MDLQRDPFWWSDVFADAERDSALFTKNTCRLTKGYVGVNHCYYAFKSNEVAGREMSKEDRDFINKQISVVRARVEQFFSRLTVW